MKHEEEKEGRTHQKTTRIYTHLWITTNTLLVVIVLFPKRLPRVPHHLLLLLLGQITRLALFRNGPLVVVAAG